MLLLCILGLVSILSHASAVTDPNPGHAYYIKGNDGQCLTVDGYNTNEDGRLNMWDCLKQTNQIWDCVNAAAPYGDKWYYQYKSRSSGLCLTLGKGLNEPENYTWIYQHTCAPVINQVWEYNYDQYRLKAGNLRCLSYVPGKGGLPYLYDCSQTYSNQYIDIDWA